MSAPRAEDPIAIALLVAAAVETAGGTYFVGGSVASSLQGDPRTTKIDLFGVGRAPFDVSEFARKSRMVVLSGGASLVVKSAEDSVLRKLLWFREGGEVSDRQWRDVVAILRVGGPGRDRTYLAEWAHQLRCEDLLARAEGKLADSDADADSDSDSAFPTQLLPGRADGPP
jgi:hypothetical protein